MTCSTIKYIVLLFIAFLFISKLCIGNELSLNGIVPVAGNADGYGWTAGISVGGFMSDNNVDLYAGYWEPPLSQSSNSPQIAVDALIFPSADAVIFASTPTNIIWDVEKITDNIDGTNLTISKIDLHYADTTNFILEVTNNIANTLGKIELYIPAGSWSGETNYVLKFEVVDSSSLTNSRIFWDNTFAVVPEPCYLLFIIFQLLFINYWKKF